MGYIRKMMSESMRKAVPPITQRKIRVQGWEEDNGEVSRES